MTHRALLERPALVDRLRRARVGIVEAPGGFGKTTLALELADALEVTAVRVTADGTPGADAVVAATAAALRERGLATLAESVAASDPDDAVDRLTAALGARGEPVLVHVDEVQALDADAARWVADLVRRLPEGCRAVLTGRRVPPALAAACAGPDTVLLGPDDLRFGVAELARLLERAAPGEVASARDAADLLRATDGWPAAAALVVARRHETTWSVVTAPRSLRMIMTDLLEAGLSPFDPDQRARLGRLAAAPLLSPEAADLVAGPSALELALAAGLPLTRAADGWLRLPDPIREVLAGALDPATALALARHYADEDALPTAVALLHGRGDTAALAALIAGQPWHRLEAAGTAFARVVLSLVGEAAGSDPELLLALALAVETQDRALRRRLLDQAEAATAAVADDAAGDIGRLRRAVLAERARDASRSGNHVGGAELAGRALAGAGADELRTRARALYAAGMADTLRCTTESLLRAGESLEQAAVLFGVLGEYRWQSEALARVGYAVSFHGGQVARAVTQMERALALLPAADADRALLLTYHMDVLDIVGRADAAEAAGREALATGLHLGDETIAGFACWGLALVASHRGDHEATRRWIAETERHAGRWMEEPNGVEWGVAVADMLAALGDEQGACAAAEVARPRAAHHRLHDALGPMEARLAAMFGDPVEAEQRLVQLEDQPFAVARNRWVRTLLRALAAARRGDLDAAARLRAAATEQAALCGLPDLPERHERALVACLDAALGGDGAGERRSGTDDRTEGAAAGPGDAVGHRVTLLGRFGVAGPTGEDLTPASGHPASLVKLLALRGQLAVDEVIDVLWPEADAATGRSRLRNLLNRVRSQSGALVVRHGEALSLAPSVTVDVREFERAAADALTADTPERAGRARAALSLHRGELLPADRYDDWAAAPRERVRRRCLALTDLLAAEAEERGDVDEALALLDTALALEPADEGRAVTSARLLLRQGRRAAARAVLAATVQQLDELGVAPGPALARLAEELGAPARI